MSAYFGKKYIKFVAKNIGNSRAKRFLWDFVNFKLNFIFVQKNNDNKVQYYILLDPLFIAYYYT